MSDESLEATECGSEGDSNCKEDDIGRAPNGARRLTSRMVVGYTYRNLVETEIHRIHNLSTKIQTNVAGALERHSYYRPSSNRLAPIHPHRYSCRYPAELVGS